MAKSTKVEVDRRVEIIFEMIIDGWSGMQIARYISANMALNDGHPDKKDELDWSVTERQIYEYYAKAEKLIEEYRLPKREAMLHKAIIRYENLMRRSIAAKDFRTAKSIQERIDKLNGLEAKQEISVKVEDSKIDIVRTVISKKVGE